MITTIKFNTLVNLLFGFALGQEKPTLTEKIIPHNHQSPKTDSVKA